MAMSVHDLNGILDFCVAVMSKILRKTFLPLGDA